MADVVCAIGPPCMRPRRASCMIPTGIELLPHTSGSFQRRTFAICQKQQKKGNAILRKMRIPGRSIDNKRHNIVL